MKKTTLLLLISLIIGTASQAQKSDSTIKQDTAQVALIGSAPMFDYLTSVIMDSRLSFNGVPLNGKDLSAILNWLNSRRALPATQGAAAKKK